MTFDFNTTEFFSPKQLAKLLGISTTSVYRIISRREIHFYKIGHNIRFRKADVLEYLNRNSIESFNHEKL
jgi:excisionase family DNA binding protein